MNFHNKNSKHKLKRQMQNVKKMVSTVNKMGTKNLDRSSTKLAIVEEPSFSFEESKDERSYAKQDDEAKNPERSHPSLKAIHNEALEEDKEEIRSDSSGIFSRKKLMTPNTTGKKFDLNPKYATQQMSKINFRLESGKKRERKKYKAIRPSSTKGRSLWESKSSKRKVSRNSSIRSKANKPFDNMVYDMEHKKKLEILERKKHIDRMYTFNHANKSKSRKYSKGPQAEKDFKEVVRSNYLTSPQGSKIFTSNFLLNKASLSKMPKKKKKSKERFNSPYSKTRKSNSKSKASLDATKSLLLSQDYILSSEDAKKVEFLSKIENSMLKMSDDQLKSISELSKFFLSKSPTRQQLKVSASKVSFIKHH